jgi:2-polyprenyl-3-methyl-5-hydroxy-6-metoxy-1,4-benzoquinol methylase
MLDVGCGLGGTARHLAARYGVHVTWFRERAAALDAGEKPALGFHVLLGSDAKEMFVNQVRNLEEGRIRLVQVVAEAS